MVATITTAKLVLSHSFSHSTCKCRKTGTIKGIDSQRPVDGATVPRMEYVRRKTGTLLGQGKVLT